jgi:hypothetical protein
MGANKPIGAIEPTLRAATMWASDELVWSSTMAAKTAEASCALETFERPAHRRYAAIGNTIA